MLTIKQLMVLVQPGDWFTTIDLKDAYFHVEIAPELSGRPHSNGQVQGMGNVLHSPIYPTPNQLGLCDQLEKEHPHTSPTGAVFGSGARCRRATRHPVREQTRVPASGGSQGATVTALTIMQTGSHGGCSCCGPARVTAYAPPAEVVL